MPTGPARRRMVAALPSHRCVRPAPTGHTPMHALPRTAEPLPRRLRTSDQPEAIAMEHIGASIPTLPGRRHP